MILETTSKISGPEELYLNQGSTINLTCSVKADPELTSAVFWYHDGQLLNYDSPRGGISLRTDTKEDVTTSKLLMTGAKISDSGNYSCIPSSGSAANIILHVIDGKKIPITANKNILAIISFEYYNIQKKLNTHSQSRRNFL